jgi:hypothetical protein
MRRRRLCGDMGLSTYLFDPKGELCPWPFVRCRRHWDWDGSPSAFADYAVMELGFVELRERPFGFAMRLSGANVAALALIATIQVLSDLPPLRTAVCAAQGGAPHKMFRSPREAIAELVALWRERDAQDKIFLRRVQATDNMREGDALGDLMRLWSSGADIVKEGRLNEDAQRFLRGRFALLQVQSDHHTLLIKDWGRAYGSFDERWVQISKGLRFEDQPDYRYASAAVGGYHEAARLRRPVLDDVDALIQRPRSGRARIRYRRLIVPTSSPTGSLFLLSTSLEDRRVDLRSPGMHQRLQVS